MLAVLRFPYENHRTTPHLWLHPVYSSIVNVQRFRESKNPPIKRAPRIQQFFTKICRTLGDPFRDTNLRNGTSRSEASVAYIVYIHLAHMSRISGALSAFEIARHSRITSLDMVMSTT